MSAMHFPLPIPENTHHYLDLAGGRDPSDVFLASTRRCRCAGDIRSRASAAAASASVPTTITRRDPHPSAAERAADSGVLHPVDHPPRVPPPRPRRQPQPPLSRARAPVPLLPRGAGVDPPQSVHPARTPKERDAAACCDRFPPPRSPPQMVLFLRRTGCADRSKNPAIRRHLHAHRERQVVDIPIARDGQHDRRSLRGLDQLIVQLARRVHFHSVHADDQVAGRETDVLTARSAMTSSTTTFRD